MLELLFRYLLRLLKGIVAFIRDFFKVTLLFKHVLNLIKGILEFIFDFIKMTGKVIVLMISGKYVCLTETKIKSELNSNRDLRNKGAIYAVVDDFVKNNGFVEICLSALNANNQYVGNVKMRARFSRGIKKGDVIRL